MEAFFDFEKPIATLEKKLQDLRELAQSEGVDFVNEIAVLERRVISLIDETYAKLTPWQKVQLSRHPSRPYVRDYIDALFPDFMEMRGDRCYGDDQAIIGGVAQWPPVDPLLPPETTPLGKGQMSVLILGHQKGRTTKQKMERNFGMAKPEGYRKCMRLMDMAARMKMPILTFIDTPGAYPGMDAEERGQSQAIAESIHRMFELDVPIISTVIGEGGSGGALAIGVGNRVLMQEYTIYSVISPESCASILWSDSTLAERASEKLKMSPTELLKMKVIDAIIPEPKGGAHRDWPQAFSLMREHLIKHMKPLLADWDAAPVAAFKSGGPLLKSVASAGKAGGTKKKVAATAPATATGKAAVATRPAPRKLVTDRLEKFRAMGQFALASAPVAPGSSAEE